MAKLDFVPDTLITVISPNLNLYDKLSVDYWVGLSPIESCQVALSWVEDAMSCNKSS